jgi:potassium-transporting ATPase potassium-binding subunit
VNAFTPLGGLVPMWLIQLGQVIFGGVGSGLYGMLMFAVVAVFVAGLMVGRTPEYLGKKIEAYEMKMASLVILIPRLVVLIGTAIAVETGVDDFLAQATPEAKLKLIREHQSGGRLVAMTGDGTNDAPALAQADVAVAMNS